jgi:hypothetical protein
LLTVTALLIGCAQTVYKTQLEVYCPKITQYDEAFNNKLADEVESLPSEATAIPEALSNYAYLRDRIRRCENEKGKL